MSMNKLWAIRFALFLALPFAGLYFLRQHTSGRAPASTQPVSKMALLTKQGTKSYPSKGGGLFRIGVNQTDLGDGRLRLRAIVLPNMPVETVHIQLHLPAEAKLEEGSNIETVLDDAASTSTWSGEWVVRAGVNVQIFLEVSSQRNGVKHGNSVPFFVPASMKPAQILSISPKRIHL